MAVDAQVQQVYAHVVHDTPTTAHVVQVHAHVVHDTPVSAHVQGVWAHVVHDTPVTSHVQHVYGHIVHSPIPAPFATYSVGAEALVGSDLSIGTVAPAEFPDHAGIEATLTAGGSSSFNPSHQYDVYFEDGAGVSRRAFSGNIGDEYGCSPSSDGATMTIWPPPLPLGTYTIRARPRDVPEPVLEFISATDAVEVVHRTFPSTLFALRASTPGPRNTGPASLDQED